MPAASRPQGWTFVPPPLLFIGPLVIGVFLDRRVPLVTVSPSFRRSAWLAGIVLVAAGVAHALTSVALFALNRTTIIPHHRSTRLVLGGAYRWTRNPMYVGLTLAYLGICAITTAIWPLLFLPMIVAVIDRKFIPMEERQMEEAFGAEYVAYKSRVKRWL